MKQFFRSLVVALLLTACGGALKYNLRGTELSPGSDAKLTANVDEGRNVTQLDLQATNLTPAERILEGGTVYVVWQRRDANTPWSRLGALELADGGRSGKATLSVAEIAFDLLVSVEQVPTVASPSGKTVFEQRVSKN